MLHILTQGLVALEVVSAGPLTWSAFADLKTLRDFAFHLPLLRRLGKRSIGTLTSSTTRKVFYKYSYTVETVGDIVRSFGRYLDLCCDTIYSHVCKYCGICVPSTMSFVTILPLFSLSYIFPSHASPVWTLILSL